MIVARALGALVAFVVGTVLRVRRAHVEAAMTRAGVADPGAVAERMYRSLGWGLFELIGMALSGLRPDRVRLTDPGLAAVLGGAGPPGRGAVLATAHTGNWDLAACAVAARAPLTVVTKRFSVGLLDRLWQGTRRARGVRLVSAGGAARGALAALGRGELVAMLVDQAPERARGVVRAPFLGALAWVDLAPALVAMRARVPVVVLFPRRLPDGTHTVDCVRMFTPPPRPSHAWAEATMVEITWLLDAFVRQYPEQWLWMHRRWKDAERPRSPTLPGGDPFGIEERA